MTVQDEPVVDPAANQDPLASGDSITIPGDEGGTPPADNGKPKKPERTFSAEDIAKARKEEKDKLYSSMQKLEDQLKELRDEKEQRDKAEKDRLAAEKKAQKDAAEKEMDSRQLIESRSREWEERERERDAQFAALTAEIERRDILLAKEREFNALREYRLAAIQAHEDEILPELRDFVSGSSEEEIDNSVASLIERTTNILGNIQAAQQAGRAGMRTAPITAPPVGPADTDTTQRTYTVDDLRNMDMNEYAKNRDKLLSAAGRRDRGLLG